MGKRSGRADEQYVECRRVCYALESRGRGWSGRVRRGELEPGSAASGRRRRVGAVGAVARGLERGGRQERLPTLCWWQEGGRLTCKTTDGENRSRRRGDRQVEVELACTRTRTRLYRVLALGSRWSSSQLPGHLQVQLSLCHCLHTRTHPSLDPPAASFAVSFALTHSLSTPSPPFAHPAPLARSPCYKTCTRAALASHSARGLDSTSTSTSTPPQWRAWATRPSLSLFAGPMSLYTGQG